MANYAAEFAPQAERDLENLSSDVARRVSSKILELEEHPFPRGDTVKQLQGYEPPMYRLRIGDYRAIFRIFGQRVVIYRIIHRSQLDRALRSME